MMPNLSAYHVVTSEFPHIGTVGILDQSILCREELFCASWDAL